MKRVIQLLCVLVFCYSAARLLQYGYSYIQSQQALQDVQQYVEQSTEEALQAPMPQLPSKTEQLRALNEEIVGWLTIDGTQIHNPILQAPDNDFYLHHNHLREKSRAGSIFVDYRNDVETLGRHTILYGHVMRDGTMFGELDRFAEQSFADAHSMFTMELMGEQYEVEIFAAYETTTEFYYIDTDFADEKEYATFLQSLQRRSIIATTVDVTAADQIITFSTCTTSPNDDERFVVHGKIKKT